MAARPTAVRTPHSSPCTPPARPSEQGPAPSSPGEGAFVFALEVTKALKWRGVRLVLILIAGLLPLILPLPGGGSGRVQESERSSATFRTTVRALEPEEGGDTEQAPQFPRFLKRKALAHMPESPAPAPPEATDAHELLLTFDDGPDLEVTPLVLEELDRRGLKAIFFVNGKSIVGDRPSDRARRHLLRKLAAHGHFVGNHSFSHQKLCREQESIPREIDGNAEIITAATGVYPRLFRSPYGGTCPALEAALAERNLLNVGWNVDPQEWRGQSADTTVPAVTAQLERLSGRGILLLHDTHPSTARALPRILDWIEARNRRGGAKEGAEAAVRPMRIVDYTVLLPARPLAPTGLEAPLRVALEGLGALPGQTRWRSWLSGGP